VIFNKGVKTIAWENDSLFNKWCWETGYLHAKELNWAITLHYLQKLTQINKLNKRAKTVKLLEGNM